MKNIREFFSTPFQLLLVVSFSLVAAIAIAIGFWAISQTISDYLSEAMNERVARDMQLAQAFYDLQLREIEGLTDRLARDPLVIENLTKPEQAGSAAIIDQQITGNLAGLTQGGNHLAAVLDESGKLVGGQLLLADGSQKQLPAGVDLQELEIFQQAMTSKESRSGTGIIPAELLSRVGLEGQAKIGILDTPRGLSGYECARGVAPQRSPAGPLRNVVSQTVFYLLCHFYHPFFASPFNYLLLKVSPHHHNGFPLFTHEGNESEKRKKEEVV